MEKTFDLNHDLYKYLENTHDEADAEKGYGDLGEIPLGLDESECGDLKEVGDEL